MFENMPLVTKAETPYAIIFNPETLKVSAIRKSRNLPKDLSFVEVNFDEVEPVLSGKEPLQNCRVTYNVKTRKYELLHNSLDTPIYSVAELIYKIPDKTDDNADIQVVQDIKNTCWKILIGGRLYSELIGQNVNIDTDVSINLTQKHNPNIFYRRLKFSLKELIKNHCIVFDFIQESEFNGEPLSVYTVQRFDTYSYEVNK